jgi:peptide/nickel transport system substrate-binding protein
VRHHAQRIAETDPFKQVTEAVGSGPFRFKADERVPGSRLVYERFDKYRPREDGEVSFTAGPKIVYFDRVEWHVLPDTATKAAALQTGEMDWWADPPPDLLPLLRRHNIEILIDGAGTPMFLRPNHLYPPFDKPAVRRALMGAIDQAEVMVAMMGDDTSLWSVPCGFIPPVSPLASDAGLSLLTGKRDYAAVAKALEAAGYEGETLVLLASEQDKPLADIAADVLKRVGMNVDYQAMDTGTAVQRRALTKPPKEGGWNLICALFPSLDLLTPATNAPLRGNGKAAWVGCPTIRGSKNCVRRGSTLRTWRRRRRLVRKSNSRRSRACLTGPSGSRGLRRHIVSTSPMCRRALRSCSGMYAAPNRRVR